MSDLSPYRFPADEPVPFRQTGLDVIGPLGSKTPSQSYDKRYALILTCLTCREVHIEMFHNLFLNETVIAFCRFFCNSDNGTDFTASEKELIKLFHQQSLQNFVRLGTTHLFLQRRFLLAIWTERL